MIKVTSTGVIKPEIKNTNTPSRNQDHHPGTVNSPAEEVLHLQRTIGNQAVSKLIESGQLQAKQQPVSQDPAGTEIIQLKPAQNVRDGRPRQKPRNLVHEKSDKYTRLWEGMVPTDFVEADRMSAWPITIDQWATGSRTNNSVRHTSRHASRVFGRRFVAGHLLNNWLGGTGEDYKNITAFTSRSNSKHFHGIEKEIKQRIHHNKEAIAYRVEIARPARFDGNKLLGIENIAGELHAAYAVLREGGDIKNISDYEPGGELKLNLEPGGEVGESLSGRVFADIATEFLDEYGEAVDPTTYDELTLIIEEAYTEDNPLEYVINQIRARIHESYHPLLEEWIRNLLNIK
jgi:hypothetical protein